MTDFQIGASFETTTWGRITVVDIHPAILQLEQRDKGQFWVPFSDLREELSGKKRTDEKPPRLQLRRFAGRKRFRGSRPLHETDSVSDSEE